MNKKKKRRYNIGDVVRVRDDLILGCVYYNDDKSAAEVFSHSMEKNMGWEATIIDIIGNKYTLDIDDFHFYTDEMLENPIDKLAKSPYTYNEQVENLIDHINNYVFPNYLIDKALDEGNKDEFIKLTEKYFKQNK